jgi:hypothetical protein
MDLQKMMALFERAEMATDRKEAQKVLKKVKKIERKEKEKQQPYWKNL